MEGKIRIKGATERNRDVHCEQNKRVKHKKREILGVSDVICSICTKARLSHTFHSSNRLYQAEQSEQGRAVFWLVSTSQ